MRVTILGGLGFIGSSLAERCVANGHEVTVFDRLDAPARNISPLCESYRLVNGDFSVLADIERAIRHADVVVHAISATLPGNSISRPDYDVEANVLPSIRLFQACVNQQIGKVVFISSGGTVYGIPRSLPLKETDSCHPIVPYGLSKEMIEKSLAIFAHHHGLNYTVLRLSNPYGPGQTAKAGQGVIAAWMEKVRKGEPIEIWGDGKVIRDYVYIDDAVAAIAAAACTYTTQRIFNVGAGVGHSLRELHQVLESSLGLNIPIVYRPARAADVPASVLDITEIKQALGWSPMTSIEDGLRKTWRSGERV